MLQPRMSARMRMAERLSSVAAAALADACAAVQATPPSVPIVALPVPPPPPQKPSSSSAMPLPAPPVTRVPSVTATIVAAPAVPAPAEAAASATASADADVPSPVVRKRRASGSESDSAVCADSAKKQPKVRPKKEKDAQKGKEMTPHERYLKMNRNFVRTNNKKNSYRSSFRLHRVRPGRGGARLWGRFAFRGGRGRRVGQKSVGAATADALDAATAAAAADLSLLEMPDLHAVAQECSTASIAASAELPSAADDSGGGGGAAAGTAETAAAASAAAVPPARPVFTRDRVLQALRELYSFTGFRPGQEQVLMRVLHGHSTLAVLPTGGGKSLCYQVAAYLLGFTLVISPLVSLMADQLAHLPAAVPGAILSQAHAAAAQQALSGVLSGAVRVLFVSPERLLDPAFEALLRARPPRLVCVDEAHCVSEWSHAFRPAYLRMGAVLRRIGAHCVLGLTATATARTCADVMSLLGIPAAGLVAVPPARPNLLLSASMDSDRDQALLQLLRQPPLDRAASIIVYAMFQAQTEHVAAVLRNALYSADCYHGERDERSRAAVQAQFASGRLRIVVATVAFGMGLDKADVDAVIHYSLPRSLESWVQEVGRAGRGGQLARCHLFLDVRDLQRLRSFALAEAVDAGAVLRLLRVLCADVPPGGDYLALSIEKTERELDMKSELISTLLAFVESRYPGFVTLQSTLPARGSLTFYRAEPADLRQHSPVIAALLDELLAAKRQPHGGRYPFALLPVCARARLAPHAALAELRRLDRERLVALRLEDEAFVLRRSAAAPVSVEQMAQEVLAHMRAVEAERHYKLNALYTLARSFATRTVDQAPPDAASQELISAAISRYFSDTAHEDRYAEAEAVVRQDIARLSSAPHLRADIRAFIYRHAASNPNLTARAVARILHGIASPAFQALSWKSTGEWGRCRDEDFARVLAVAEAEMEAAAQAQRSDGPGEQP